MLDKNTSITLNTQSNYLAVDSTVISTPVCHVSNINGEQSQLEKCSSANLLNAANDDDLIRLEQAATKAQAAFRGYLVPLKKENGQISMVLLFQSQESIAGVKFMATSMTLPLLFVNWIFLVKYMKKRSSQKLIVNFVKNRVILGKRMPKGSSTFNHVRKVLDCEIYRMTV
ncbi:unnamed protein product [Lactuca virosa]|uniref:Uncharacterized protein n=1 Tax=Lactuca virosa TaxID=75947 RepID=A0AAU9PWD2_9ASTR|nr:unnamed protein product [Lactuca virosa]